MKKVMALVLGLAAGASFTRAQTPPNPGPEYAKLAGFIGNWTTEGTSTASPFGPGEKCGGGRITSEWFDGRFAVVRHAQMTCATRGNVRELDVITYDAAAKNYTWYAIDGQGTTAMGKGSISGDTLTMVWEVPAKGKVFKIRGRLKGLGTDKFAWAQEYSDDGKMWTPYVRATDVRLK